MIGLYCRLSVADGEHGEESDSIANQRMILADFVTGRADLRGKERRFFVDDGISGTHADNRPALQELLALCREGRCEAVVVKDLSRLSRDDLFCVDLVEDALPSLGVRVIAVADGYDSLRDRDRPSAGTELGFKAIMNSWYSKDLSFKVTQSIRSSQRRGVNLNTVPFGYAKDAEGNCVIDPEGAEVVRRAFDLALSGKSQAQIAKVLNAERMVTPRNLQAKRHPEGKWEVRPGARWSGTMVKSLVTNPHYKGTLVLGKRRSVEVGGRRNRKTGDDERYVFDGAHEGIVTAREWERAQRAMTSGATGGAMPRSNRLFAGRIFCGRCGRAVPYRTDRKDDPAYTAYCGCWEKAPTVAVASLERAVNLVVRRQMEAALGVCRRLAEAEVTESERSRLAAGVALVKRRKMAAYEGYRCGGKTPEEFRACKAGLDAEQADIERRLREADRVRAVLGCGDAVARQRLERAIALSKRFADEPGLTRDMVEAFVSKVVSHGEDDVEIALAYDDIFSGVAGVGDGGGSDSAIAVDSGADDVDSDMPN